MNYTGIEALKPYSQLFILRDVFTNLSCAAGCCCSQAGVLRGRRFTCKHFPERLWPGFSFSLPQHLPPIQHAIRNKGLCIFDTLFDEGCAFLTLSNRHPTRASFNSMSTFCLRVRIFDVLSCQHVPPCSMGRESARIGATDAKRVVGITMLHG